MSSNNSSMYSLPIEYRTAGFSWNIAIFALILTIVAIFGILFNIAVVWVTIKTKSSLQGTANFHLALGSIVEVMHQSGHFLFLYVLFSGQNFIQYWLAVHICTIALFGMGSVALCLTFNALDRLFCVLFPLFSRENSKLYRSAVTIFVLIFCSINVYMYYGTAEGMPDFQITGSIQDLMQGAGRDWYNNLSFALNMVTLGIYILIVLVIHSKKAMIANVGQIFKSISVLICINLSGFISVRAYRLFVYSSIKDTMLRWYITQTCSIILNVSTASTGPILYATSREYRNAFQREFPAIFNCIEFAGKMLGRKNQRNDNRVGVVVITSSKIKQMENTKY